MRRLVLLAAILPLAIMPKSDEAPTATATVEAAVAPTVTEQPAFATKRYDRLDELVYATMPTMAPDTVGDERCLAQAVYFEARSENLDGQLAVAQVVLNRVADHRYPNSICGVVFQNEHMPFRCQFSFACDGRSDNPYNRQAWAIARAIAHIALDRDWRDLTDLSTHYHAAYATPSWMSKLERRVQVGHHVFYRDRTF